MLSASIVADDRDFGAFITVLLLARVIFMAMRSRWFHRRIRGHTVRTDTRDAVSRNEAGWAMTPEEAAFLAKFDRQICSCGKTWP
ncbi:MAG: hypothetical protein QOD39_2292 [Mycobacterium sp.]|jgi:hypothetical protein|nr:hypothetical protein [Mycobacterium sp.]